MPRIQTVPQWRAVTGTSTTIRWPDATSEWILENVRKWEEPMPEKMKSTTTPERIITEILDDGKKLFKNAIHYTDGLRKQINLLEGGEKDVPEGMIALAKYLACNVDISQWRDVLQEFVKKYEDIDRIALLSENFIRPKVLDLVASMMVVPVKNPNNHNYKLGETFLVSGDLGLPSVVAETTTGSFGNALPRNYGSIRPATEKEILQFVAKRIAKKIERCGIKTEEAPINYVDYLEALGLNTKGE